MDGSGDRISMFDPINNKISILYKNDKNYI